MDSQIERIKASLSIAAAWSHLGLRGRPSRDCLSPFRDDNRPSFSVYSEKGWERWWDHGTAQGGDVVDLWAKARELAIKDAIDDILRSFPQLGSYQPDSPRKPPISPLEAPESIRWPHDLRTPTDGECRALGALRGLDPLSFAHAGRYLGTLKVATVYGAPAWIITDASGICAEARRFDGQMYERKDGKKLKSFALPGSKKFWPVGLQTDDHALNGSSRILLVEGGPDYFAALSLCLYSSLRQGTPGAIRPAAILGAAMHIGLEAEEHIRGAHVVIIPHNDIPGQKSADRWIKNIRALGARKLVVQPLPIEHDDLNDFLVSSPTDPWQLLKGFQ